ncbi:MAG: hypothetical protein ACI8ZO_001769 [Flavobacteriales bacterium]
MNPIVSLDDNNFNEFENNVITFEDRIIKTGQLTAEETRVYTNKDEIDESLITEDKALKQEESDNINSSSKANKDKSDNKDTKVEEVDNAIKLFPNPGSSYLTISLSDDVKYINMVNMQGQNVKTISMPKEINSIKVDTQETPLQKNG